MTLASDPAAPAASSGKILISFLSVFGAVLLVGTELGATVAAALWAVVGVFHLGEGFGIALGVALGAPAVAVLLIFARTVLRVEGRGLPET